jgi:hypothetical protein
MIMTRLWSVSSRYIIAIVKTIIIIMIKQKMITRNIISDPSHPKAVNLDFPVFQTYFAFLMLAKRGGSTILLEIFY